MLNLKMKVNVKTKAKVMRTPESVFVDDFVLESDKSGAGDVLDRPLGWC